MKNKGRRCAVISDSEDDELQDLQGSLNSTTEIPKRTARKSFQKSPSKLPSPDSSNDGASNMSSVLGNSQNTTAALSKPGCSRSLSPDSNGISQVQKRFRRVNVESSPEPSDSDSNPALEDEGKSRRVEYQKGSRPKPLSRMSGSKIQSDDEDYVEKASHQIDPEKQIMNAVNKFVNYVLVSDQKKYLIKKQAILKNVFTSVENRLFPVILKKSNTILKNTFGLQLIESDKKHGDFILANVLKQDGSEFVEYSQTEEQIKGLVFYVLTLIFMNENAINEEDLWKALEPLGINVKSNKAHPAFGDVRKLLTDELVKQTYLQYRTLSREPPEHDFVWGLRAHREVSKKKVLEFACKVDRDTNPEDWRLQYADAHSNDREGP